MMEKILIYIKHHFAFIWKIIDRLNALLFSLFYGSHTETVLQSVLKNQDQTDFSYCKLQLSDAHSLFQLLNNQDPADLNYFHPHGFDLDSIKKQFTYTSFLMMGVFKGNQMVGYFFLRFFFNKKCFVGRLIDKDFRGKGIGETMNTIMYETAWNMGFRCLSTISKNNKLVIKAHAKNRSMVVLKELQNDYLLVEFVKNVNN